MSRFFDDHILEGDHASRPSASTTPNGALYSCSTHSLVYKNNDGTWETWATLGATASAALTINAQTGTSYTLVLGDAGEFVTMDNASASTLTVPANSSVAFAVGTQINGAQLGAGQVTLVEDTGVTINAAPGLLIDGQYGTFGLLKIDTDEWLAFGRLSA